MVGFHAGGGIGGIKETPEGVLPDSIVAPYIARGDIHLASPSAAFAMERSFQQPTLDLAYVVASSDTAAHGDAFLTMGVLLSDINLHCSCGGQYDEQWGLIGEPLSLFSAVPESHASPAMTCVLVVLYALRRNEGNEACR